MKKTEFLDLLQEGKWGGGKAESVSLPPKVHMLLSSDLFEMLSAPNLLRATACKYGESSDRTKILVFVLFHRKHPFGELLSKIVLKSSIARLFL